MDQTESVQMLESAALSGDAKEVEVAIQFAYLHGLKAAHGPSLVAILKRKDHFRHEDAVTALQILKQEDSVDALFDAATIQHKYLAYDESFGLARKCTWALADIGSTAAFERLRTLAADRNTLVAAYAQKRIARWDDELDRKASVLNESMRSKGP